ncbi:MFS transporter [Streptomyces sp. NPDC020719]|uniref:MFS transporter n=1 Tax=Streptomyces sp. NPDC020719 TaxID=3154896 RepID=UPI0033F190EB
MARVETTTPLPKDMPPPMPRHGWVAIGLVLVAAFMQLVDVSIVNVAVTEIQRGLGADYTQIQWVLAGYTLAFAVLLVASGRMGDRIGRKRVFLIGMSAFTVASLLCGVAQNPEMLVGSRLLQGLAAALMYPQVYSVIQVTVPVKQRGAVLGVLGGVIGLAAITGPLVGGLLIQTNLFHWGWRPIFLVNVPIGLLTVLLALRFLPESRADEADPIDWAGVVLITLSVGLLVYPLVEGRDLGWPRWLFGLLAAGALGLLLFAAHELRRERTGRTPLIRMSLFANRGFSGGLLLVVLFYGAFLPFFLVFSVYAQAGLGYTALQTGVTLVPYAFGSGLGSGASIALASRLGRSILHIGLLLLIAGTCWITWTVHHHGSDLHRLQMLAPLLAAGLGFGLTVTPLVTLILAKVPLRHAGSASGTLTTAQQFGSAVGIALLGSLFFGLLGTHANTVTDRQSATLIQKLTAAGMPAPQADRAVAAFKQCFHDRASEKDSTVMPASCRSAAPASGSHSGKAAQSPAAKKINNILADTATRARHTDFAWSAERTLYVQIGAFGVCLVLVWLLPKVRGKELAEFEEQSQETVIIG